MDETDNTGAVQSDNSDQGGDGGGFYQEYLNKVPEDYRPHVEPYVKEVESNANKKFAEHAEYRKNWEPYEQLGINEYEPESLQQLLQFAELMQDEEQFKDWWKNTGETLGLFENEDDDLGIDDDDDDFDVESALDQIIEQRMQPFIQEKQERDYEEQVNQASEEVSNRLTELQEEHGLELDEEEQRVVYRFAYTYADDENEDDPIGKGFQDFQRLVGDIETSTVESKANAPAPPERPGKPNTSPSPITDFKQAKEAALERFSQSRTG